ncbi:MAG: DinB family protein [Bryobacterales bacterium]
MNAAEAKSIAHFLLEEMASEASTTTRLFGAVPEGRLDYKPDASAKTALGLLRHITLEDEWLLTSIADGSFVPPPDDSDACGIMTPQDAIARYGERVPPAIERVRALSGDDLVRQLDLLGVMQMPAIQFLSMTVKHSVHHRGQLSTYLRPMGGKVPGIYGPSADTQM